MPRTIALVVALLLPATPLCAQRAAPRPAAPRTAGAKAPSPSRRPTRAESRAVGAALFKDETEAVGVVHDTTWERRLDYIVRRLQRATGIPDLEITYAILDDADVNAAALPGGFVLVKQGMLHFVDSLAAQAATDSAARAATATSYLAAVLGHELAHVTLGHGDEAVEEILRRSGGTAGGTSVPSAARFAAVLSGRSDDYIESARRSRDLETAADHTGALYLLRAGWQIQHAMDMMRALDVLERQHGSGDLGEVTWLRDHPRASAREADLEGFRARLKMHQSELDDALTLLANEVAPDTALVLLDRVLADFPDLQAARHARAAALQQLYFATQSVQSLKLRSATPTFGARFLPGIRGEGREAARLLPLARAQYRSALALDEHPYTLSSLAVLDVYAGDAEEARRRAARAAQLAPDDVDVMNNLAVVAYLMGDRRRAQAVLADLVRAWGDSVPARVLFNYGRVLVEAKDPSGTEVLESYALMDEESGWTRLARTLIARSRRGVAVSEGERGASAALAAGSPGKPSVAGVALGDSPAAAIAALGEPAERTGGGGRTIWHYPARGISLVVSPEAGVRALLVEARVAGPVGGVSVGDPVALVRGRWGRPTDGGGTMLYSGPGWTARLQRSGGLVTSIAVSERQ